VLNCNNILSSALPSSEGGVSMFQGIVMGIAEVCFIVLLGTIFLCILFEN